MSNDDLWGDLPEADTTADPVTLLRQQASLLGKKTRNILEGVVKRFEKRPTLAELATSAMRPGVQQEEREVAIRFSIRCPALDNYVFHALTLEHPLLTVFPVKIHDESTGQNYVCRSETELREALQTIFASPQLRRVISALLREAGALAQ